MQNDNELDDNIPGAGAPSLRESNPRLFGEEPSKSALADLSTEELAALSKEGDDDDDDGGNPASGGDASDVPERDPTTGKFIPKARFDEVNAERKAERERADAAEAKAAELERERQERKEAERVAAEKKAKEVHDYDADRAALDVQFDKNELTQAEYRQKLREIDKADRAQDRRLAEESAVDRVRKETKAEREAAEKTANDELTAGAEAAAAQFVADPENEKFIKDRRLLALLNAEREAVFEEYDKAGKTISWAGLWVEAKKRVEVFIGEKKPAAAAESDAERVARERRAAQARTSAAASALPARPDGGTGARATPEPEDENDISPEEWRRLSKAERDKRLGKDGSGPKFRA